MQSTPAPFVVKDYSAYVSTSLVYLEQARYLIAQTLPRDESGIRRDPSNYWYNEWVALGEEIPRLQLFAGRARRVLDALQSRASLAGVPVPTIQAVPIAARTVGTAAAKP